MEDKNNISGITDSLPYDDWVLLSVFLIFILLCLSMSNGITGFVKFFRYFFSFKKTNNDVCFSDLNLAHNLIIISLFSLSVGTLLFLSGIQMTKIPNDSLRFISINSGVTYLSVFVKLLLYSTVNQRLYKKHLFQVPPAHWTEFYVKILFLMGAFLLVIIILIISCGVPPFIGKISLIVILAIFDTFIAIKSFSLFFRKKIGIPIFFIYLCALEIAPVIITWLILR